jgi:hypothetical protein
LESRSAEAVTPWRLMMNSKGLMGLLSLTVLVVSGFALAKGPTTKNLPIDAPQKAPRSQVSTVPEYVVYGNLFKKVSRLSEKTRELRRQGQIGQRAYFPMQKEASLSEAESTTLEAIALACQQDVARQDERARIITEAFRARFPGGKLPNSTALAPPPPELKTMWDERNAIVLRARDQLRLAFGEKQFPRFDRYAKLRYLTTSGPASLNPLGSESK